MNHFKPNKHERIERRKEKRNIKHPNRNQPEPTITTISVFGLRPKDPVWWYHVNPKKPVNLDAVAARLGKLLEVDLVVAENVFNRFDVYLTNSVQWCDVERYTLQVLREQDGP